MRFSSRADPQFGVVSQPMHLWRWITGRFPPDLEPAFLAEYKIRTLAFVRMGLGVAIFMFFGSQAWDHVLDPANAWKSGVIRALVSITFLGTLALTFRPAWFFRVDQPLMGFNCVLGGTGLLGVLALLDGGLDYRLPCIFLILMYAFGFLRLLFTTALAAALVLAAELIALDIYLQVPPAQLFSHAYLTACALIIGGTTTRLLEGSSRRHFMTRRALDAEKKRVDDLLLSIFPAEVAKRLESGEKIIAESHGEGTALFADLVGFTTLARRLSPAHVVEVLNDIFSMMDRLSEKHGIEKIKTIGDAYMAATGVTKRVGNSAEPMAEFALDLLKEIDRYAKAHNYPVAVRVGLSTGRIVSGVIGSKKPSFDLWGDTINLASRMESHSETGCIQVNETAFWRLQEKYQLEKRGTVNVKGIGEIDTYFLRGRKPQLTVVGGTAETAAQ
jgi:class 3 adenylate cyclase